MKYMGSKSALLAGELGTILRREAVKAERFVDLFAGSGAVSHYVAERVPIPTLSIDVQKYSESLVMAVTGRTKPAGLTLSAEWIKKAREEAEAHPIFGRALRASRSPSKTSVIEARTLCRSADASGFIMRDYGGHYFSPIQALALDLLYAHLPSEGPDRTVALGALIKAASRCAAAPGHTAQPFQPTQRLLPFVASAWAKDAFAECDQAVTALVPRFAKRRGSFVVADCLTVMTDLRGSDLVFCDPPYSEVQYSRFYHVLEGIAAGGWPGVSGRGRSPDASLRVSSAYSRKSTSGDAFAVLLRSLRDTKATVVFTFPSGLASNGVSGSKLMELGEASGFTVECIMLPSTHSTLGGPSAAQARGTRTARRSLNELLLVLRPK